MSDWRPIVDAECWLAAELLCDLSQTLAVILDAVPRIDLASSPGCVRAAPPPARAPIAPSLPATPLPSRSGGLCRTVQGCRHSGMRCVVSPSAFARIPHNLHAQRRAAL